MSYSYFVTPHGEPLSTDFREKLFLRMQDEGLLPFTMHAFACPSKEDWLALTVAQKGWLVCCVQQGDEFLAENVCGMAMFVPWQGRVWSFEFTAFREHFSEAVAMSRGVLQWIFANAPCDTVLGLSALSNRHAWRLARQAGFEVLGHVEGACYMARRCAYEEGVLVMAKRSTHAHGLDNHDKLCIHDVKQIHDQATPRAQ